MNRVLTVHDGGRMTFYFIVKSVALAGLARFIILQVPETEVVSVGCRD